MSKKSAALALIGGRPEGGRGEEKGAERRLGSPALPAILCAMLPRLGLLSVSGVPAVRRQVLLLASALLAADLWVCPLAALFGIPCPGCGLTRAALALARGEWSQALALHPLSPLLVPLVLGMGWALLRRVGDAPAAASSRPKAVLLWSLCALLVGVWLARFGGAFGGPVPVRSLLQHWRG